MRKPWLAVVWFFLFWCPSLALTSPVTDEPQLVAGIEAEENQASFFEAAAQEVDVPPELTRAIARVESGGTPYALNVEGRGYFFDSKEEALAAASEAQAAGKSFDSGVMQINNWWLKRYDIPLEAVFDPAANILLGSWILRQELDRHGDTWTAVARYHSPNADLGNQYVALVRRALEKGAAKTKKPKRKMETTGPLVVYRGIPKTTKPAFSRTRPGQPGHYQEELVAQNRVFVRRQP